MKPKNKLTAFSFTSASRRILKRADYLLAAGAFALTTIPAHITIFYDGANCDESCLADDMSILREEIRELIGMPQLDDEMLDDEEEGFIPRRGRK